MCVGVGESIVGVGKGVLVGVGGCGYGSASGCARTKRVPASRVRVLMRVRVPDSSASKSQDLGSTADYLLLRT